MTTIQHGRRRTALMQRYGARIGAIEVWNEANLQTFCTGTPDQIADMTARTNTAVNATTHVASSVKSFFGPYAAALKARGFPMESWAIYSYPAGNASPVDRYNTVEIDEP